MFEQQAKLPVDLVFGISPSSGKNKTHSEYVKKLRERLQESYELTVENSRKMNAKNKARFDLKVRAAELMPGDWVLVRNLSLRGKHKLADRWEKTVHTVVKRISESPIYIVKPEKSDGPHYTLHRDLLLPCRFLPASPEEQVTGENHTANRKRGMRTKVNTEMQEGDDYKGLSSDEEGSYFQIPTPEIVTRSPYIIQVDDGPLTSCDISGKMSDPLNPHTAESSPRISTIPRSESVQPMVEPTREESKVVTGGIPVPLVSESAAIENALGHIAIEIQEEIVLNAGLESQELSHCSVDAESIHLRRSGWERRPPKTLEYEELGKPILLALMSFFDSLGGILSASLPVNTHAGTHAI